MADKKNGDASLLFLIKIHPIVGRLIDPAVLEKLRVAGDGKAVAAMGDAVGNA